MTRSSADSLHQRLPALIRHLHSKGVPVDWAVLLRDLEFWDRNRDAVATRWLQTYYRTLHATPSDVTDLTEARTADTDKNEK